MTTIYGLYFSHHLHLHTNPAILQVSECLFSRTLSKTRQSEYLINYITLKNYHPCRDLNQGTTPVASHHAYHRAMTT